MRFARKRIVIEARNIDSTTGRYMTCLLDELQRIQSEFEFFVVVPSSGTRWTPSQEHFQTVTDNSKNYRLSEQTRLRRLIVSLNPDLVHFTMPQQPLLMRVPIVTTVHDLSLLRISDPRQGSKASLRVKQLAFFLMLQAVVRRSSAVICPSEYTASDLERLTSVNRTKICVTPEAPGTPGTQLVALPRLQGERFLLYVGRSEPYKNNRRLILAHQQLIRFIPDLKLVIVGGIDSFRRRDINWVADNGFEGVLFLGYRSDEELTWLYSECAAYAMPSLMEGFGLTGVEAMRHGAPVVSSNSTCLPEVHGDAAVYFDGTKVEDMVGAFASVLLDDALRSRLRIAGRKQAARFSWTDMANRTLDVYRQCLDNTERLRVEGRS